ncbi:MAG: translocation/assembly module TamB domain-containing protein, partial [Opitutales bacterium]
MRFLRPRRVFYALVLSLAAFLLAVWSSQWWLPWVAPRVLEWASVSVETVERVERGRMRVEGIRFEAEDGLRVTADFIELPNLWVYARTRLFSAKWSESQELELGAVSLRLGSSDNPKDSLSDPAELTEIVAGADRSLSKIELWLPPVHVRQLTIFMPDDAKALHLEELRGEGNLFTATCFVGNSESAIPAILSVRPRLWKIEASVPRLNLDFQGSLNNTDKGLSFNGSLSHMEGSALAQVSWKGRGLIPDSAALKAENFVFPRQLVESLGTPEINSVRIRRTDLNWDGERYLGKVEAEADTKWKGYVATVSGVAALEGDSRSVRIQKLDLQSPWAKADLSEPLIIRLPEMEFAKAADFLVSTDLSMQPFISAEGVLKGRLSFQPPGRVQFEFKGDSVLFRDYPAADVVFAGAASKTGLELWRSTVVFPAPTAAALEVSGKMDLPGSLLDFQYKASASPEWVNALGLPDLLRETLYVDGALEGEASAPEWSANWKAASVQPGGMKAFEASGRISGTGKRDARVEATLVNQQERIGLNLKLGALGGEVLEGALDGLLWAVNGETRWALSKPSAFALPLVALSTHSFEFIVVEDLELSGPVSKWRLQKSKDGPLLFSVEGLQADWFNPWIERAIPEYAIPSADVTISQIAPFVVGEVNLSATDRSFELGELKLDLQQLRLGEKSELKSLRLALSGGDVLEAAGTLPLRINWPETELIPKPEFEKDGPVYVHANLTPSQAVSKAILQLTGLRVEPPRFEMEVNGSLTSPSGYFDTFVPAIKLSRSDIDAISQIDIPDLKPVEVRVELNGRTLQMTKFKAGIRGGLVEGTGQWPLNTWLQLKEGKDADAFAALLSGAFELNFSDWALENWTPYLPAMLRRSGVLSGSLRYDPDSGYGGVLSLKEIGLRPTQDLPAVDSIYGSLILEGRTLQIEEAGARVGGSPVSLKGQADFTDWPEVSWLTEVEGNNVPVVRRPEMILRSDLDLKLSQERGDAAPNLTGRMALRSSTMLVELDPLSPTVRTGPASKPPFFAIEEEPFNQWGLDLRIEGERFLRVRSPYFQSVLSVGLNLTGRLGEPLLLGSIRVDEGSLGFPGAKMRVDSGEAYIEPAQPDVLRL